ncbi:hypothetical protein KR018_004213, partial [Drosophila ironensis]
VRSVNATYSYLTNLEVMQILQKVKGTKKKFGMRNLATVTYEALQYLEDSPCKTQTREAIGKYVKDLSSYRLKSHEILQMVNDPPTSALHTQLLIDDNKAPLTDEENEKIIQLSAKHFHSKIPETKPSVVEKAAAATAASGAAAAPGKAVPEAPATAAAGTASPSASGAAAAPGKADSEAPATTAAGTASSSASGGAVAPRKAVSGSPATAA